MSGLLMLLALILGQRVPSACCPGRVAATTHPTSWARRLAWAALLLPCPALAAPPVAIISAENVYGDIAQQIGGSDVNVRSIMSNPDQDPHLFEVTPSVGRDVSAARVVIVNGAGYDPWMTNLLRAAHGAKRQTIVVALLVGKHPGDNPHLWYDPAAALALATTLEADLAADDPAHKPDYERRLVRFRASIESIEMRIEALRAKLAGTPVTATEPVFGAMFAALGMQVRNMAFQLAVMNNTEPGASDVATFENDLRAHKVRLLVYNSQATDPVAARMARIATQSGVPVVGASETEPPATTYQAWMTSALDALDHALAE